METISLRVDIIVYLVDMELTCGLWILFYFKLNVCRIVTSETLQWTPTLFCKKYSAFDRKLE